MYEAGLSVSIYLVNSIAGSIYVQKFLREKYQKKIVLFAWTGLLSCLISPPHEYYPFLIASVTIHSRFQKIPTLLRASTTSLNIF